MLDTHLPGTEFHTALSHSTSVGKRFEAQANFFVKNSSAPEGARMLLRFTQGAAFMIPKQRCQSSPCFRRALSRYLLLMHDRWKWVDDEFHLTQNLMSQMLGVQRTGVTAAAGHPAEKEHDRLYRGKDRRAR